MIRILRAALLIAILPLSAIAGPPNVVADIRPVHSLVAMVMGDLGTPALLLDGAADPHHLQLRPSQARLLAGADAVFWIGPDLMPWLESRLGALAPKAVSVPLLAAEGTVLRHPGGAGTRPDPHAWLDPQNASIWLNVIARELGRLDPQNAAQYHANAQAARTRIETLQKQIAARLAPTSGVALAVSHDALGYFADRFGLRIAASVSDTEANTPGASRLRDLHRIFETENIACLFVEPGQNTALAESLVRGRPVRIVPLDPLGNALKPGPALYGQLLHALANGITGCAPAG